MAVVAAAGVAEAAAAVAADYRSAGKRSRQMSRIPEMSKYRSKEELLFIYCYEKPKSGILPYARFVAYDNEILSGAVEAMRAATGKNRFK